MQVNLPTFWETPKGSGRYSIKSQKVISHAWDQCWSLLTTEHRNKDSAICLSGIQENTVSCTGAGGPMMSASWQQTGIMSFKNGCTNTNAKTAHTLITPEIKTWIDGQVKEIEKGRTAGKTNGAVIAPAWCYFFHGTWFGSKCPQKGQQKKKQGESQEKEQEPKMRGPEKECAFLFGKWIGKNCKKLSTLPKKKADKQSDRFFSVIIGMNKKFFYFQKLAIIQPNNSACSSFLQVVFSGMANGSEQGADDLESNIQPVSA
ncbi:hypothetical protein BSKO_03787 [Bryopsis sp. KO-2023]|nr:hypothetical protein BSKO_03787 [Bryopsis sp. KO-2023]